MCDVTLRVLLAEDSSIVRLSIASLLASDATLSVFMADNGIDAVRVAVELRPDVAVLDYAMPGMTGVDVARLIRQTWPDMPMILLTAVSAEHLIAAAFNAGIRGYVLKADAGEDLIRAIHAVRSGATFVSPGASRVLYERYLPASGLF